MAMGVSFSLSPIRIGIQTSLWAKVTLLPTLPARQPLAARAKGDCVYTFDASVMKAMNRS
jgi:hypothetical protein